MFMRYHQLLIQYPILRNPHIYLSRTSQSNLIAMISDVQPFRLLLLIQQINRKECSYVHLNFQLKIQTSHIMLFLSFSGNCNQQYQSIISEPSLQQTQNFILMMEIMELECNTNLIKICILIVSKNSSTSRNNLSKFRKTNRKIHVRYLSEHYRRLKSDEVYPFCKPLYEMKPL